jgi:hypothetical protein
MSTVIPIGYANLRFTFSCAGVTDEMGFSVGCAPDPGKGPEVLAEEAWTAFAIQIWKGGTGASDQYIFTGVTATIMSITGPVVSNFISPSEGTLVNAVVPPNCCLLISKNTAVGGRKGRGRLFMVAGVLFETEVDAAGRISAATVLAHNDSWETFQTSMDLDGNPMVLLHSDGLTTPTPISSFTTSNLLATQRRRMR